VDGRLVGLALGRLVLLLLVLVLRGHVTDTQDRHSQCCYKQDASLIHGKPPEEERIDRHPALGAVSTSGRASTRRRADSCEMCLIPAVVHYSARNGSAIRRRRARRDQMNSTVGGFDRWRSGPQSDRNCRPEIRAGFVKQSRRASA